MGQKFLGPIDPRIESAYLWLKISSKNWPDDITFFIILKGVSGLSLEKSNLRCKRPDSPYFRERPDPSRDQRSPGRFCRAHPRRKYRRDRPKYVLRDPRDQFERCPRDQTITRGKRKEGKGNRLVRRWTQSFWCFERLAFFFNFL